MAYPKDYVKEAKSFIVDNSLFRHGLIIRCLCGYTGDCMDDWLHFRALAMFNEHYKPERFDHAKLKPPVDAIRIYICPRCGTAKCNVYDADDEITLHRHPVDLGFAKARKNRKK
jgi:acetone carboxylase gamma subunit